LSNIISAAATISYAAARGTLRAAGSVDGREMTAASSSQRLAKARAEFDQQDCGVNDDANGHQQ